MQNYLVINTGTNICDNIVLWDGDTSTWQPPDGHIALPADTIPAMIWVKDESLIPPDYILREVMGAGGIGFTWDGSVLTTDQPKPAV